MAVISNFVRKKTIPYRFSEKHKDYIRRCKKCSYNVAEGAVRARQRLLITCLLLHMS